MAGSGLTRKRQHERALLSETYTIIDLCKIRKSSWISRSPQFTRFKTYKASVLPWYSPTVTKHSAQSSWRKCKLQSLRKRSLTSSKSNREAVEIFCCYLRAVQALWCTVCGSLIISGVVLARVLSFLKRYTSTVAFSMYRTARYGWFAPYVLDWKGFHKIEHIVAISILCIVVSNCKSFPLH